MHLPGIVRTKGTDQVTYHKEIQMQGGKDNIAVFPLMKQFPIVSGFSWGKGIQNTSTLPACDRDGKAWEHTEEWLKSIGLSLEIVRMESRDTQGPTGRDGIVEVTKRLYNEYRSHFLHREVLTKAEFIYTKVLGITLMVKVADCLGVVVYAKNSLGEDIVGLGHWGRKPVDEMNPAFAIAHLLEVEKCESSNIFVGIMPGISYTHHTLTNEDIFPKTSGVVSKLPHWQRWVENGRLIFSKHDELWHVDLLGRIIDMLTQYHIPVRNIYAYEQDTYTAAEQELAFSHRYATEQDKQDGRMIVAAGLRA